jgi:hypothetical protein
MSYGIKISLPGSDVNTANTEQLAITSEKSMLKQERQGTTSYTFSGSPASVTILTINHNLGYEPAFIATWESISLGTSSMLPYNQFPYSGLFERIFAEVTTTQFFIKYVSDETTPTTRTGQQWNFRYTIWYDEAF